MKMDTSEFDLDKYLRASSRVDVSAVDWGRIGDHPVSADEPRCLAYMMDIETTPSCSCVISSRPAPPFDPEVTSFLSDALKAAARRLGTPLGVG